MLTADVGLQASKNGRVTRTYGGKRRSVFRRLFFFVVFYGCSTPQVSARHTQDGFQDYEASSFGENEAYRQGSGYPLNDTGTPASHIDMTLFGTVDNPATASWTLAALFSHSQRP